MRSVLRTPVLLIALVLFGCQDDDEPATSGDASAVLPGDAGSDAGNRADAGHSDTGTPAMEGGAIEDAQSARDASALDAAEQDAGEADANDADAQPADATDEDANELDANEDGAANDGGTANQPDAGFEAGSGADAASGPDAAPPDSGAPIPDAAQATSFARVLEILRANCASCHTTGTSGGLRFDADPSVAYAQLADVHAAGPACGGGDFTRVIPGDPDASLLIRKLEPSPPCGDRMPRGRTPLSSTLIAEIRSWIAAGAPAQ